MNDQIPESDQRKSLRHLRPLLLDLVRTLARDAAEEDYGRRERAHETGGNLRQIQQRQAE
jgi:hypothetical protein